MGKKRFAEEDGRKLKQDDVLELEVTDNGMDGEGIAKFDGYTVFIPFCIKGERVVAKINHVRKDKVAFADLKEVKEASPVRVKPPCNRFTRCGGCQLMHMEYPYQLEVKRNNLNRLLSKNADTDLTSPEVIACSEPLGYRNKIQLPFGEVQGRTALGFYRPNSHKVVSITKCFLHGEWAEKLIAIVLEYAERFGLKAYNEETGRGTLKHLVARYIDGKLSVVVVTDDQPLKGAGYLLEKLQVAFPSVSLYQSKKPERTNVILGKSVIPIKSEPFEIEVLGVKAEINPFSFLQLNAEIRDKIYSAVIEEISKKPSPVVIDAYAGVGLLGAVLALRGARVYNIEIVKEATADAERLTSINSLRKRVTNINGDAAVELPKLINELTGNGNNGIGNLNVVLDPPRKGCDARVIEALNALNASVDIFYISCNPATLTRDIKMLSSYEPIKIQPYDMFCQTSHAEVLARLVRKQD